MKKAILVVSMILMTACAMAQRLETCTMDGFGQTVKAVLLPDMDKACGMVSSPSFNYMSSIMLYPQKKELVYRKAQDTFAEQSVDDGVPVETSTLVISEEQNAVLTALFDAAVGSARTKEELKPGELYSTGVDGTTYHVFKDGKAGKCWSPGDNESGRLVNLMDEISRYVRNHRPLSDQLIQQAKELTKSFMQLQSTVSVPSFVVSGTKPKTGDIISGIVRDENGPIPMVNITERDSKNRIVAHALSDVNGEFSFKLMDPANHLSITYVGYNEVRVEFTGTRYEVTMVKQQ